MIRQITSADGWFFVTREAETEKLMVFPIAAWALSGESVIGLVGDTSTGGGILDEQTPRLVTVPPMTGMYKHLSTLSDEEVSKINSKPRFLTR